MRPAPATRWKETAGSLELPTEMRVVVESRPNGDLNDGTVRVLDWPVREAHAHLAIESGWAHAEMTTAEPLELPNRDAEFCGGGSERQSLRQIFLHWKQCPAHARLVNTFRYLRMRLGIAGAARSIK